MQAAPFGAHMPQLALQQYSPAAQGFPPHGPVDGASGTQAHTLGLGSKCEPRMQATFCTQEQRPEQSAPPRLGSQVSDGSSTHWPRPGQGRPAKPPQTTLLSGRQAPASQCVPAAQRTVAQGSASGQIGKLAMHRWRSHVALGQALDPSAQSRHGAPTTGQSASDLHILSLSSDASTTVSSVGSALLPSSSSAAQAKSPKAATMHQIQV
ncbi:MAG: hypothetical protein RL385_2813 [Pseudomonadota bacterium]